MKYKTGETIQAGDCVLIEHGKTMGVVDSILEKKEQYEYWGLKESGLMIKAEPFGLVFWPDSEKDDPVELLRSVSEKIKSKTDDESE